MAFTRKAMFLKWDWNGSGYDSKYCFMTKVEEYQGGDVDKPASYSRALLDGSLQRVYAPKTLRRFMGVFIVEDTRPGTSYSDGSETISVGNIADLKNAWAATDLVALSFEDSAYWDAEWQGPWPPKAAYDPLRNTADIPAVLVER